MQTVAIIGAGYTGTLTAVHLLRSALKAQIILFERGPTFGRGVAYGTRCRAHVLNVPAGRMSAFEDDADHFLRWAKTKDPSIGGGSFVPRELYGAYLESLLGAEAAGPAGSRLERVRADATSFTSSPDAAGGTLEFRLPTGEVGRRNVQRVVLALGNLAPATPGGIDASIRHGERYIADPWDVTRVGAIRNDETVLIVGTGLTMTDMVLQLVAQGHHGPIHAISRRGLLSQPHRSNAKAHHPDAPADLLSWPRTALGLLRSLRNEIERAAAHGMDWREVVTSIRGDTARLWKSMGIAEQRRFLTHLRSFWDTHRHRSAPESAAALEGLIERGALTIWAGRTRNVTGDADGLSVVVQRRGEDSNSTIRVNRIINCTGPDTDLSRSQDPLIRSLRDQGLIRPDALGLGLDATDSGAAMNHAGQPSTWLFCAGGLRRPQLWETTAVPELRIQTAALAMTILESAGIRAVLRC